MFVFVCASGVSYMAFVLSSLLVLDLREVCASQNCNSWVSFFIFIFILVSFEAHFL